ncbi:MAG: LuxR family transcriptional regulator [Vannielia sp.]|uniref:helix-turn-helix transcriptional regulator n=1 Tax=Rhodobacterales TaxID=204455 RepID=UPI0020965606|nr:LuxR family transcriptional regulator [Oceanicola sp. 502str15]MCO6382114.1 LuxR family transcriptional regulator [Oceanicola sp. 502str15]
MLNAVEKIVACRDVDELWACLKETMAHYGFPRLFYGYTTHRSGLNLGDRADITILSTLDPNYMAAFLDTGLYYHAPMVRWGIQHAGASSWRWVADRAAAGLMDADEQRVQRLNESYELRAGITLSFPMSNLRSRAGISLVPQPGVGQDEVDEIWARDGREIWALNNVAHLKIANLPQLIDRRPLTPRQREALEWVGDGKTTADIALIMGLTPSTVEKHLRLAREALGVETTAQAVLKASMLNQIYLVEAGA